MATRSRVAALLTIAAAGGAGTMSVELSAVRLLAPWFGSSLVVWTNVIAVVLLALALGYLLGGRLSARERPASVLGWALLLAAGWTAWVPALASPVARTFLPAEVPLDEAAGLVLWGSLASSLLLFLPAALLLGTIAPLAVEAVQRAAHDRAGHAGGLVLSVSTIGSLVGVFATTHWLLPYLGLTSTFLLASLVLGLAGIAALLLGRRGLPAALLVLLVPLSAVPLSQVHRPEPPEGVVELATAESPYQSVRVVEDARNEPRMRFLQVNESFDSFQSAWVAEEGLLPAGYYYNAFALPPWWGSERGAWRVLILGLGGGTTARVLRGTAPPELRPEFVGVELDRSVVEVAEAHLDMREADDLSVLAGLDARLALRVVTGRFQQVVLDCYANQVEIPPHLATVEMFREVRERLAPGGWLTVNVGGFSLQDPVVTAIARTCAAAFEADVLLLRVPLSRNVVIFAREDAPLPGADDAGLLPMPDGPVGELFAGAALPAFWTVVSPGDETDAGRLTDDHSPLELLQQRSLREARLARESRP
jgi:spermidine synthase